MQNYGNALKYSETAANSAGTATQKMSVYQNSLEAKTKAATAAFEELSKTIINGDIFKGVIDAGGTLSNVLTSIVKSGAGIPALIASISAGMSIAGKNAGKEYAHLLRVA
jgi:phage-related protein